MASWELKIIAAEARRLIVLAAEDAELRAELRALAEEILAATDSGDFAAERASGASPQEADSAPSSTEAMSPATTEGRLGHDFNPPETAKNDRGPDQEPLRELTLGQPAPRPIPPAPSGGIRVHPAVRDDDVDQIESRCRAKAEAARWAAERQRRIHEGYETQVEDAPSEPALVEWADRLTDCFYWVSATDASQSADLSLFDDLGGCFETVAKALALVADGEVHQGISQRTLPLLAEAQSALRQALLRLQVPDDPDRLAVYERVRESAARHRVFLKRFMRADDLANPSGWPDLLARIEKEEARHGHTGRQSRHEPGINRLRVLLKPIPEGRRTEQDWQTIVTVLETMVEEGMAPSNREVRELLRPVLDDLPDRDDWPHGFRLVVREIDRFLANHSAPIRAPASHEPAVEVREVERLLAGRKAVLIGGSRRRDAQGSLRTALGLEELIWVETKEHQAVDTFEAVIARADVALILLAIRWSSHAFGDVKQICDRYGKPLVRLPGGYNANQVAVQILAQCSRQLRRD